MKLNKKSIAKTLIVLILITTMLVLTGCTGNNGEYEYYIGPGTDCPLDTGIALVDLILDALWFILLCLLTVLIFVVFILGSIGELVGAILWGIIKIIALGFAMIIRWIMTIFAL